MEEQDLDIVEFEEHFNLEWVNNKFRAAYVFGGVRENLKQVSSGGYMLPTEVRDMFDNYIAHIFGSLYPESEIVDTQESYKVGVVLGRKVLTMHCKAMVVQKCLV